MGASFDIVGEYKKSFSGRSIAVELQDRLDTLYISFKEVEAVKDGKQKTGTVVVLKSKK